MEDKDNSELYWSTLEKIYVHNVYENISSKYDEFFKLSNQNIKIKKKQRNTSLSGGVEKENNNHIDSATKRLSEIDLTSNEEKAASNKFKNEHNNLHKKLKHNAWPKVKTFLVELEPNSLIGSMLRKKIFYTRDN